MSENTVTLTLSIWDFGCLPALLTSQLAETEKNIRSWEIGGRKDAVANAEVYAEQLRGCLKAVRIASAAPMSADEADRFKAILGIPT